MSIFAAAQCIRTIRLATERRTDVRGGDRKQEAHQRRAAALDGMRALGLRNAPVYLSQPLSLFLFPSRWVYALFSAHRLIMDYGFQ